jgi:protein ImuB
LAFACLFIPDFPVQAVVRQDPDLRNKPVAILEGAPPLTKVFAANQAARALGVELGMTKLQAEACGGVEWRWRSTSQEATAQAALLDCAWTVSPRIEEIGNASETGLPGAVVLDIAGCEKLFGSHEKIAIDLKHNADSSRKRSHLSRHTSFIRSRHSRRTSGNFVSLGHSYLRRICRAARNCRH